MYSSQQRLSAPPPPPARRVTSRRRLSPGYNHFLFPSMDEAVRQRLQESPDARMRYMDISLLYSRPDGHARDCFHYCAPGPWNEVARLLLTMLQSGELSN